MSADDPILGGPRVPEGATEAASEINGPITQYMGDFTVRVAKRGWGVYRNGEQISDGWDFIRLKATQYGKTCVISFASSRRSSVATTAAGTSSSPTEKRKMPDSPRPPVDLKAIRERHKLATASLPTIAALAASLADTLVLCDEIESLRRERDAIEKIYVKHCDTIQDVVQEYKIGLGGENIFDLAAEEIRALRRQVEAMEPVVEAALAWDVVDMRDEDPSAAVNKLSAAVTEYRASLPDTPS